MNLTLSIDEQLAQRSRQVAQVMGKSLNQLVREYLEQLTQQDDARAELEELRALSGTGHSGGQKFDRDALHDRSQPL